MKNISDQAKDSEMSRISLREAGERLEALSDRLRLEGQS